jgi:L-iditol 2-dehydrogenase
VPEPAADELLLRIEAAGICGTDLHLRAGEYPCRAPVTLGHEFAGTVMALGRDVSDWAIGERVTSMPFARVCGQCWACQAGDFGQCAARRSYGSGVDGGFAEYLAVKASGAYRLPAHVPIQAGALTEPLACVTKAVHEVGQLQPGESVVILGPGPIGLLATQVVLAGGGVSILLGLRRDASRLRLGRELGAPHTLWADDIDIVTQVLALTQDDGAAVVLECSGALPAFDLALALARRGGRVIQVGLFGRPVSTGLDALVLKALTVRGSFASSRASWAKALELLQAGVVKPERLISHQFGLDEWEAAFRQAADGSGLKVIFTP